MKSSLEAHSVALEAITALAPVLTRVSRMDRDLHLQMRSAANSMTLNIGAAGSTGGNCRMRFSTALGSAREVRSGLQLAIAWGYVSGDSVTAVEALLDRVCAMLWRLVNARER